MANRRTEQQRTPYWVLALSRQGFLANGQFLDQILSHAVTRARFIADRDHTVCRDAYLGFNDVFLPVTLRRGNIPRQVEIRERGEGNVMGAANSGFQHTPAPHRDAVALGDVVNLNGLGKSADAADLDIDDSAGTALQSECRGPRMHDRFIEANSGAELLLQA